MAIHPICPVLVIKDKQERAAKKDGKYRWGVCTDGSDFSYRALHYITKMMDKSKDEIQAMTCRTSKIDVKNVEHHILDLFKKENVSI